MFAFFNIYSQTCKIEVDEKSGNPMLMGICSREAFLSSDFSDWFSKEYSDYSTNGDVLSSISKNFNDYKILIVMGTWCGDSRREIPRLYKILDEIQFPDSNLFLVAVNRKKQGLFNEAEGLDIQLVPTIIFYKNGGEIGRIIETPVKSLEEDIKDILTK
jgi:thiol-disulfide isomerase/thioredoxin